MRIIIGSASEVETRTITATLLIKRKANNLLVLRLQNYFQYYSQLVFKQNLPWGNAEK